MSECFTPHMKWHYFAWHDYYEYNNNYELRISYKQIERKWSTGSTHVHCQFCIVMCWVIIFISYNSYHQCCKLTVSRNICDHVVQHSLQLVSDSLWSPSENDIAVVDSRHYKGVHQCHRRLRTECTLDMSKLTKMLEVGHADFCDVFLEAEIGWELSTPSTLTCWLGWIVSAASCREG